MKKNTYGFTLVELLVTIAIIGVLFSIVIASMNGAKRSSDYLKRVADLGQVKLALTKYQLKYGRYPTTGGLWAGHCAYAIGGTGATNILNYIPTLVTEKYLPSLPTDTRVGSTCVTGVSTYVYRSDTGRDYKLIVINPPDIDIAAKKNPEMVDTQRPTAAYGFWSPQTTPPSGGQLY